MQDDDEFVVRLHRVGLDVDVPPGWVAEQMRWDGQDHQIAYDPRRSQVMRASAGSLDSDLEKLFVSLGWARFGVDREGAELWVRARDQCGLDRLDELRTRSASPPDSVHVS